MLSANALWSRSRVTWLLLMLHGPCHGVTCVLEVCPSPCIRVSSLVVHWGPGHTVTFSSVVYHCIYHIVTCTIVSTIWSHASWRCTRVPAMEPQGHWWCAISPGILSHAYCRCTMVPAMDSHFNCRCSAALAKESQYLRLSPALDASRDEYSTYYKIV
jgi:hypothetical protein